MLFAVFRALSVVIFVGGPVLLGLAAVWATRHGRRGGAVAAGLLAAALVAVGVDAFFIEPTALEIEQVTIHSDRIDAPVTIALLADIQTDDPGEYERRVFARVAKAQPDLILLAGDYLQMPGDQLETGRADLRRLLREAGWSPPLGAFAVGGNNEYGHARWTEIFEGTGVETVAEHRLDRDLGLLRLTALPARESFATDLNIERGPEFHVVLGHAPDFSLGDVQADLMLAGHTHGGQVQLPLMGPLLTFSKVPRTQAAGHSELAEGRHLVVSHGIGMERASAPRLRFLCRPQVVLIHVVPA